MCMSQNLGSPLKTRYSKLFVHIPSSTLLFLQSVNKCILNRTAPYKSSIFTSVGMTRGHGIIRVVVVVLDIVVVVVATFF